MKIAISNSRENSNSKLRATVKNYEYIQIRDTRLLINSLGDTSPIHGTQ